MFVEGLFNAITATTKTMDDFGIRTLQHLELSPSNYQNDISGWDPVNFTASNNTLFNYDTYMQSITVGKAGLYRVVVRCSAVNPYSPVVPSMPDPYVKIAVATHLQGVNDFRTINGSRIRENFVIVFSDNNVLASWIHEYYIIADSEFTEFQPTCMIDCPQFASQGWTVDVTMQVTMERLGDGPAAPVLY